MTKLSGKTIQIQTARSTMPVYETGTADGGKHGIVLFMDAGGVRDSLREIADRFAAAGHYVLVPELYYRQGEYLPFDMKTVFDVPEERERLMGMAKKLSLDEVEGDISALLNHFQKKELATQAFMVGYCMGGRLAFAMASRFGNRIKAAASIHGGNLASDAPNSPHLRAKEIRAKLYFAVAEEDNACPPEQVARLEKALDGGHVEYEIEHYPAKHGFAVRDAATYDEVAQDQHFDKVIGLFAEG